MEGKVWLFIEIHKKLKEIKKNILAAANCTCIWPILTNLTLRMWILPAGGSLASVRDELGNRRLRRSSRKGGVGGIGRRGGRKKSLDSIQSKREFMPANPRNQSKFPATLNIQDECIHLVILLDILKDSTESVNSKDLVSNPVLQECFPIKTQEDYNEVSLTCVRLNKIII